MTCAVTIGAALSLRGLDPRGLVRAVLDDPVLIVNLFSREST